MKEKIIARLTVAWKKAMASLMKLTARLRDGLEKKFYRTT
jgi:hypothetical protein